MKSDKQDKPILATAPVVPTIAAEPDDTGFDLWEYVRIFRRRWLLITLSIVLSVGVAAFVTLRMTKIYRATTSLRIETQAPRVLGHEVENVVEMGTGSFWSNIEYYETQYKILESRDVSARLVRQFRLNEDPEFMGIPEEERGDFEPATVDEAAQVLQGMLTVEPVKDSRIVKIHIDSANPEQARAFADAIAKAYVDKNLESMLQSTVDAVDWLSKQLDEARDQLTGSESALYRYKKDNDILSISLEDRQNILTAQMTSAATKLAEARAERIEVESRKAAINKVAKSADPMSIPLESLNASPLIQQLKQSHGTLRQEYDELSQRYGDNFPKMVELKAKLDRIEHDISREVKNILVSVDAELDAARSTETGLKHALKDLRDQALALNQKEMDYNRLARDKKNNEQIYELLLGRSKEADLSRLLRVNNAQVLDAALLPEVPIKPRLKLNLALAFLIGLILGVGIALLVEFADRTLKTQDDVDALNIPFLGIIPSIDASSASSRSYIYGSKSRKGKHRKRRVAKIEPGAKDEINYDIFVHDYPKSQVAESCRSIRTNLMFMTADKNINRLLITSPSPQEGKTTVAINLAIAMAQSGSRVLLVDTDMRRPRVHRAFGLRPQKGISTMVLGETKASEAIYHSDIPGLDVLMCGPTPPNPAELMHTEAFKRVVDQLSRDYDRVIFDSPPVGVVTDAAILSKMVDGTVLIFKSLQTTRDAARHAIGVLNDIEAEILGGVLNDLDLNNRKYGQHYYYYYYKKYGRYYEDTEGDDSAAAAS